MPTSFYDFYETDTLMIFLIMNATFENKKVRFLEEKLMLAQALDNLQSAAEGKREIRIFMNGAFDMMQYGHMNAFRLGKSLGTHLVVGVNSDESITTCEGSPLMNDQECLTMVQGCKFVD